MSTGIPIHLALLAVNETRFEEVEKQRLLVAVIIGIAGRHLATPVEREADPLQLPLIVSMLDRVQAPG
jgi:hypothetical protein